MPKGRSGWAREVVSGDRKPTGGEYQRGPTHDPERSLVGRLHTDCDESEAANNAQNSQRPVPPSEVPGSHRAPASAVLPGTQSCWENVGDV